MECFDTSFQPEWVSSNAPKASVDVESFLTSVTPGLTGSMLCLLTLSTDDGFYPEKGLLQSFFSTIHVHENDSRVSDFYFTYEAR